MKKTVFKRKFTEEQRVKIVEEALREGSNNAVAERYNINKVQLSNWKTSYMRYGVTIPPKDKEEQEEVVGDYKKAYKKLKREMEDKDLELEILRELLKKTKLR